MKKNVCITFFMLFVLNVYSQDIDFIIRLGIKPTIITEDARNNNYTFNNMIEKSSNLPTIQITFPKRIEWYVLKNGICVKQEITTSNDYEAGILLLNMYYFLRVFSFTHVFYGLWTGNFNGEFVTVTYLREEDGIHRFTYQYSLKY